MNAHQKVQGFDALVHTMIDLFPGPWELTHGCVTDANGVVLAHAGCDDMGGRDMHAYMEGMRRRWVDR